MTIAHYMTFRPSELEKKQKVNMFFSRTYNKSNTQQYLPYFEYNSVKIMIL